MNKSIGVWFNQLQYCSQTISRIGKSLNTTASTFYDFNNLMIVLSLLIITFSTGKSQSNSHEKTSIADSLWKEFSYEIVWKTNIIAWRDNLAVVVDTISNTSVILFNVVDYNDEPPDEGINQEEGNGDTVEQPDSSSDSVTGSSEDSDSDEPEEITMPSTHEERYSIISIVGPYVSFDYSYYFDGGAHPYYGTQRKVINIETMNDGSLNDLFDSTDILTKLLQDTTIMNHCSISEPRNLSELVENLNGECEMDMRNILNCYAITYVTKEWASIEIGLTHGCEVERGMFTLINFDLPIPLKHRSMFKKAIEEDTIHSGE